MSEPFQLYNQDAIEVLRQMPDNCIDAFIVDPPYSSGGKDIGTKHQTPADKYQQASTIREYGTFSGDNRDSRSWGYWCNLWMNEALRVTKPGGYLLTFSDWRMLPTATDAIQSAGWTWRGIVNWDKGRGARAPHKGYFRHQAEYIPWGTKGKSVIATHGGPWDGVIHQPVLQSDKFHVCGKPTLLMRELVKIVPPGGYVCDLFMGSGTCGAACLLEGRRFIGCEIDAKYFDEANVRLNKIYNEVSNGQCSV